MVTLKALRSWVRLKLPDSFVLGLPSQNPRLFELLFSKINQEKEQMDEEVSDAAIQSLIQLMKLGKKKPSFQPLADYLLSHIWTLTPLVPKIIESGDKELGEMYQEIFIEVGRHNISKIIDSPQPDLTVLLILLDLMGMNTLELNNLSHYEGDKIKGRFQTQFWKDFLDHFISLGSEAYKVEKVK
jgi:hypothetical protein